MRIFRDDVDSELTIDAELLPALIGFERVDSRLLVGIFARMTNGNSVLDLRVPFSSEVGKILVIEG